MNHSYFINRMPKELKAQIEAENIYRPWLNRGYALEAIWCDPAIMESVYSQLSARERNVLLLLVTEVGCEPFDWIRLEHLAISTMSAAEARVGLLLLLKKGLFYAFRKSWGEQIFVMAHEGLAVWHHLLFSDPIDSIKLPPHRYDRQFEVEVDVHAREHGEQGLAQAVFHSLVYLKQNEIKLTRNGTVHKRQLQRWLELLPLDAKQLEHCGLKYAHADVYPASIAVILDILTRLQLMHQSGDKLVLCDQQVGGWLLLAEAEQNKRLYSIWKQVVFPKEAWLQHALLLLERQVPNVWVETGSIWHWLRRNGFLSKASLMEDEQLTEMLEEQWLRPLLAFGWLVKGSGRAIIGVQERMVYQWRKQPLLDVTISSEEEKPLYVQPDFEVLVPPQTAFNIQWELSAIADYCKSDPMSIYKLTKESLQRGLERGIRLEQAVEFLESNGAYGLPDNIRMTLEHWAKPFGKMRFEQAVLLRCEDTEIADTVVKIHGVKECLIELIGGRTWTVRADKLKRLVDLLDKAGWIPGKLTELDSGKAAEAPFQKTWGKGEKEVLQVTSASPLETGFIYSRQSYLFFEMDQHLPSIQELYPELKNVPAVWMKEYRTYHPSTRRELVEKALEWKTSLLIRHNGSDLFIAPKKLQESRGTWRMSGLDCVNREELSLCPEDWQEMKILVPGLHEKF